MEKKRKKRTKYKYKFLERYSINREAFGTIAMGVFGVSIMFLVAGTIILSI